MIEMLFVLVLSPFCSGWVVAPNRHNNHRQHNSQSRPFFILNPLFSSSPNIDKDQKLDYYETDAVPYKYAPRRQLDDSILEDLTGGRPGAIIETAEQLELKEQILEEIDHRGYDPEVMEDYGELYEDAEAEYDTDDPDALDAEKLGQWDIFDLQTKFVFEWDPLSGELDPNQAELEKQQQQSNMKILPETEKDDDGVEIGYNPIYGPSNPFDERTLLGAPDSYMVDVETRNEDMLTPQFHPNDLEIEFNEDVEKLRKSLHLLDTYIDPFLEQPVPNRVAKWHGYPEPMHYPPQNYTHNRFTDPANRTNFDELTPFRARQLAVEYARAQNAEWMPRHVAQAMHDQQRRPYDHNRWVSQCGYRQYHNQSRHELFGGTGDADLLVKFGSPASWAGGYDCAPGRIGNHEQCSSDGDQ